MPLIETEPNVEIRDLLVAEWQSNSPVTIGQTFKPEWVHTGWYDEDAPHPQISLTGNPGDASPDGINPSGSGLTAWVDGFVDCNVWVPYDRDLYDSAGVAKDFRWSLVREVHRIIEENTSGTTDGNNNIVLSRLDVGEMRHDPTEEPPPFRTLIPIGFVYYTSP